jgi:UDP-hydrolysing UDP-N-acetyl-D-glucosamine 2-epimerase
MTRKIAIMTGTRADYGLLRNLIASVAEASAGANPAAELQLIVTGTHLSLEHGHTIDEILADGFTPAAKVEIWGGAAAADQVSADSDANNPSLTAAIETGEAIANFSRTLATLKPDVVVVLGDRLEAFAMASAATVLLIPVAHIHGGELTLGAMDDSLRHAITKLSYLHFTTTEEHRARVVQLGEEPSRVFNFGAPVLDAMATLKFMSREALEDKFGVRFGEQTLMMTFHPAAFDEAPAQVLIDELLAAMEALTDSGVQLVITGTNNDIGSDYVRAAIAAFCESHPDRTSYVESFGQLGYLSMMREVDVVAGNSSSTVLEAPIFGVPSVLVGNRQEGRPMSASVLKPAAKRNEILAALQQALSHEFKASLKDTQTPFGTAGFAKKATAELINHQISTPPKKKFWEQAK